LGFHGENDPLFDSGVITEDEIRDNPPELNLTFLKVEK